MKQEGVDDADEDFELIEEEEEEVPATVSGYRYLSS